jgi:hypothetical protein
MNKSFFAFMAMTVIFLSACQKNNFTKGAEEIVPPQQQVVPNPEPQCQVNMIDKPKPTNILFIVDQSGSNVTGQYDNHGNGTDPKKTFRFGIMNRFLSEHGSKSHLSWNLVSFADKAAKSLVKDSGKPFTNGLAFIIQALDLFFKSKDGGYTPYRAALKMAQDLIAKNENIAKEQNTTLIAFITDGYPTDYCSGGSSVTNCPGQILENEIDRDVRSILSASAGEVKFSTIYYGPPDFPSSERLRRMAQVGGGQFLDLNESSNINLNDVIKVPEKTCSQ